MEQFVVSPLKAYYLKIKHLWLVVAVVALVARIYTPAGKIKKIIHMAAKILQQRILGNKQVWYLDGLYFVNKGVKYTITASESTGPGIYDVIHTIKNIQSGSYAQIEMKRLIQILLESEP
jgi:nitrate/nitrite transporter NarK